jgi:hypothetical protein
VGIFPQRRRVRHFFALLFVLFFFLFGIKISSSFALPDRPFNIQVVAIYFLNISTPSTQWFLPQNSRRSRVDKNGPLGAVKKKGRTFFFSRIRSMRMRPKIYTSKSSHFAQLWRQIRCFVVRWADLFSPPRLSGSFEAPFLHDLHASSRCAFFAFSSIEWGRKHSGITLLHFLPFIMHSMSVAGVCVLAAVNPTVRLLAALFPFAFAHTCVVHPFNTLPC